MLPRVLIIEDEPAIADTLIYALKTDGFVPHWRATGAAGLSALAGEAFALVILDVGLPDGSGFDLCRQIRRQSDVPVLFLTARHAEVDRVVGLELGADDYVTKPFSPREVTARVKAILRRGRRDEPAEAGASAEVGGEEFAVDAARCEVRYHGVRLELTRYEYRLLCALLARPGHVLARGQLMEQAWEDPGASLERTVDAHVKSLRAKLRAVTPDADPIVTHRGLGYAVREQTKR
ncbi:two-component system response regulator CreB [Horticoccus luteus]|uniref:Two-component system response regulator CreB n=1 Tax=Horticoccus luteus TaxID=2862869 RepID=A0A8F9TUS1_9BACT|nr:two-component system response regulator CreB [Horticoccus luteus]QYM79440.1 two-component system response regulator CreB [Horticoccus luteus]